MISIATFLFLAAGDVTGGSLLDEVVVPSFLETAEAEGGTAAEPAAPAMRLGDDEPRFSIGLMGAYVSVKDAEEGTWYFGIQARIYLLAIFAVEGTIGMSESEFEDGDGEAQMIPVTVSALLMPFQGLPIRPYALAGLGWYYHDVEYSGSLDAFDDETDSTFGFHVGLGTELKLGIFMLFADLRYVFMEDPDLDVDIDDFNLWSLNLGAALAF